MKQIALTWRRLAANSTTLKTKWRNLVKIAFNEKFLLYTNVTISISLSSVGDILEQNYEIFIKEMDKWDPKRTLHMGCSGAAVGVLCHHWYKVLDRLIVGRTLSCITKKLLLDQFIFSPISLLTFFAGVAVFEEKPIDNFKREVKHKFSTLYKAEWLVWPPAQIINFYFLPTKYRVFYDNTVSLGYDVYTSHVKHNNVSTVEIGKHVVKS